MNLTPFSIFQPQSPSVSFGIESQPSLSMMDFPKDTVELTTQPLKTASSPIYFGNKPKDLPPQQISILPLFTVFKRTVTKWAKNPLKEGGGYSDELVQEPIEIEIKIPGETYRLPPEFFKLSLSLVEETAKSCKHLKETLAQSIKAGNILEIPDVASQVVEGAHDYIFSVLKTSEAIAFELSENGTLTDGDEDFLITSLNDFSKLFRGGIVGACEQFEMAQNAQAFIDTMVTPALSETNKIKEQMDGLQEGAREEALKGIPKALIEGLEEIALRVYLFDRKDKIDPFSSPSYH